MRLITRIRLRSIGRHSLAAPPLPPADGEPGRCQATTRSGARCKLAGDPYCVVHRPAAPPPRAA
jgi:hypothetical protein